MKKKIVFLFMFSIITLFCILLLVFIKPHKKIINFQNNLFVSFKKISSITSGSYKLMDEKKLSNNIVNLIYYNEETDDYITYFIDYESGKLVDFEANLKKDTYNQFKDVELNLLKLKYPKFIIDGIINSDVVRYYKINDNSIVIYYKNVITVPNYNQNIRLIINNNEVKDFLNYNYNLDENYENENGYTYDPNFKYVSFTFDDGPSKKNTVDIVNYLNDNKAHATFFMLGNLMVNNQEIVNYVLQNNSEIGSHTYSHKNLKRISKNDISNEIETTQSIFKSITNQELELLRPPYGSINDSIKSDYDYSYILWNLDTNDWRYKDTDYIVSYILNNVKDGDIILMHDIHDTTKAAVEKVLPELYVRGYKVVSVSELAQIKGKVLEKHKSYRSL